MIRARAEALAKESLGQDGTIDDNSHRLKFCDYVASTFINPHLDVRTTLAMQVLTSLAGNRPEDRQKVVECYGGSFIAGDLPTAMGAASSPDPRSLQPYVNLQQAAAYLSHLADFPTLLNDELTGHGKIKPFGEGKPGVLVVMIDDLDRCPYPIVYEILGITQQWGSVRNLFFVLAINQKVLARAISEGTFDPTKDDPDYAVEKYVQHTVTVENLDAVRLRAYVRRLLDGYYNDFETSRVIADNVAYLETGLRYKTPRAVKRCLNTIRPDIRARLTATDPSNKTAVQRIIKERVLQYSWRLFYEQVFLPSVKASAPPKQLRYAWETLELACRAYVREQGRFTERDEEKLNFLLQRTRLSYDKAGEEAFPEPSEFPRDLVLYLAQEPYWVLETPSQDTAPKDAASSIPSLVPEQVLKSPDNDFMELYNAYRIAIARDDPDVKEAMRLAIAAARLAEANIAAIPNHRADEVGNLAMDAERFGYVPLADSLFGLALRLMPSHPNNIQGYISFIADFGMKDKCALARELLSTLERDFPDFKPERRLYLQLQIQALDTGEASIAEDQIAWLLKQFGGDPTNDQIWTYVMRCAEMLGRDDLLREATELALDRAPVGPSSYAYSRIRALADQLAEMRSRPAARLEAAEIYRRLLAHKEVIRPGDVEAVEHNLASLLYALDYDNEAGKIWFDAYRALPSGSNIRSAYSQYLVNAKRGDIASRVQRGEPIDEMVLLPQNKVTPAKYSDAEYIGKLFSHFATVH